MEEMQNKREDPAKPFVLLCESAEERDSKKYLVVLIYQKVI